MDLKVKNITIRIKELDSKIHELEKQLAAMNWERKKYLQFSNDPINQLSLFGYENYFNLFILAKDN